MKKPGMEFVEKPIDVATPHEPLIRVNMADGKSFWDFSLPGPFSMGDDEGRLIEKGLSSGLRWRIKLESYEPAQFSYTLKLGDGLSYGDAELLSRRVACCDFQPSLRPVGGPIQLNGSEVCRDLTYRVTLGEFNTEDDARAYGWRYLEAFDGRVIREKIREARGRMEVFDAEYETSARIERSLTLLPEASDGHIVLYDVPMHRLNDRVKTRHRRCLLPLTFHVGDHGDIVAVSESRLEDYLAGVLSAAMHADSPLDALKCQAVTSRGWILSHLGIHHADDPFDVCSQPRCHRYADMPFGEPLGSAAVEATRGEILLHENRLCRTPFTRQCGGYTEDRNGRPEPFLHAVYDGPGTYAEDISLDREKQLARWMGSQPDVYCNPVGGGNGFPEPREPAFRWEEIVSRKKIEAILKRRRGEDIGFLVDIVPLERSRSGRVRDIEILGSRKNLRLKRESDIRHAFSESGLRSTCFIVEKEMGRDGLPSHFTFTGAGNGHGAGLCQMGAMRMASEGKPYEEILKHYFRDVEIRKVY